MTNYCIRLSFVLVSAAGLSVPASARQDVVPGSRYTSARAAALGDAYLPLVDDSAAGLFYNPAGLGRTKGVGFEPLNFSVHLNDGFLQNVGANSYKVTSLSSYSTELAQSPNVFQGFGGQIVPTVRAYGFAAGLLFVAQTGALSDSAAALKYKSLYQLVPTVGYGVRLASGIIRIGYSLQWVSQASGEVQLAAGAVEPGYNQGLAEGSGFSHTAGAAITLPIAYLPAFNIVARNILGTKFTMPALLPLASGTTGRPADEPMSLDGSVSLQPKLGAGSYMNFVLEARDFTNVSGTSWLDRGSAGLEFVIKNIFYLRGGWGSGAPAAGLGLRRKQGEFSFSWYVENLGSGISTSKDTRFMLHYQIRAF